MSNKRTIEQKRNAMLKKAVLSKEVVEAIRSCHNAGMKRKDIVAKFGASPMVITNITKGHTYTY